MVALGWSEFAFCRFVCVRACVVCSFLFSHRGSECCTKLMILLHDEGREFSFLHAVLGVCFAGKNTTSAG